MTYENTFNERHYFKGFLGFQTDEFKNKSFGGSRNNYYYDGYEEMNHGDACHISLALIILLRTNI